MSLNTTKNQFAILERENIQLKSNLQTLESKVTNLNRCQSDF